MIFTIELLKDYSIANPVYEFTAQGILKSLETSIQEHGAAIFLEEEKFFFTHHEAHRFVLNGHLYCLQNLWRIKKITSWENNRIENLIKKGTNALLSLLPHYLSENRMFYDLTGYLANPDYQAIHIELLDFLYRATNLPAFQSWHDLYLINFLKQSNAVLLLNCQIKSENIIYLNLSLIFPSLHRLAERLLYYPSWYSVEGFIGGKWSLYLQGLIRIQTKTQQELINLPSRPKGRDFVENVLPYSVLINFNETFTLELQKWHMSPEEIKEIVITFGDDFSITYLFQDQFIFESFFRYFTLFLGMIILYKSELINKWKGFKKKDLQ